jgi:hypothetical protein
MAASASLLFFCHRKEFYIFLLFEICKEVKSELCARCDMLNIMQKTAMMTWMEKITDS